jgi:PIN domain nuclease of toxin-antitoxin system
VPAGESGIRWKCHQAGRFDLNVPLEQVVREQVDEVEFQLLDIRAPHVLELYRLARHHGDPFDRILIAHACNVAGGR